MSMSTLRGLSLTLVALMPQVALAADVCEGEYIVALGTARPAVSGKLSGVPDPILTTPMRVEVKECGRVLEFHGEGEPVIVIRDVADPARYDGTWGGDTIINNELVHVVDAPVRIDVLEPDHITGQFFAPGSPESATWELTLVDGHVPDFGDCNTSAAADEPTYDDRLTVDPVLRSEVIEIVADELGVPSDQTGRYISALRSVAKTRQSDEGVTEIQPGEPGCPIELTGVKTCRVFPPDTTTIVEVNVLLDAEGRLLPVTAEGSATGRVRVDAPEAATDFCSPDATETEMPEAERRLRFKFLAVEEDGINDVQAGVLDARTDHFKRAHYAEGKTGGRQGRADAADEAYQAIGAPVTGLYRLP